MYEGGYKLMLPIFSNLFTKFQKSLVDRLVREQAYAIEKKYKGIIKTLKAKQIREILELTRITNIEKHNYMELQKKLQEELEEYLSIENLYAFKIAKVQQMSKSIEKITSFAEVFHVASNEIKHCIDIINSGSEDQAKMDAIINAKSMSYVNKKAVKAR